MGRIKKWFKENKQFNLACLVMVGTGALDCYLTSKGLKDPIAIEGNPYYANLAECFGETGIYLGKGILGSAIILFSKRDDVRWPINAGTIMNSIGAGSWGLSYYLI